MFIHVRLWLNINIPKSALQNPNSNRPCKHMLHPEQIRIFKSMTPEQKLKVALRLYYSARELKTAGLRSQNPEWTEDKVQYEVREIFFYART
jgi:hypothetical protein